jgi:phage FluMu protein Com
MTIIKCPKCGEILEVYIKRVWIIFRCPKCQINFVLD